MSSSIPNVVLDDIDSVFNSNCLRLPLRPGHESGDPQVKDCIHVPQRSPPPQLASPDSPDTAEPAPGRHRSPCLQTADGPWLNEDILNTMMQHIVAVRPHLRTVPSDSWFTRGSGPSIQPCFPVTTFILPVNINTQHWVCLVVRVGQREAQLFDSLDSQGGRKTKETCKKLAARFISNCLPEPFSNWDDGWHTAPSHSAPSHYNSQQFSADDCPISCLNTAIHVALRLEVPISLERRCLRAFYYGLYVNINHFATTPASTISAGAMQQGSAQNSTTTLELKDALPSDCVLTYQNQLPEILMEKMDRGRAEARTLDEFASSQKYIRKYMEKYLRRQQDAVYSHLDTQVAESRLLQGTLKHLTTLTQALCASDRQVPGVPDTLSQAMMSLKDARDQTKNWDGFDADFSLDDELEAVERKVAFFDSIHRQEKERIELLARLQMAVAQVRAADVADRLKKTIEDYLQHHSAHRGCLLAF